ncbi:hypothetical protein [Treponema sp.]|uniref:hypothetical protein n=1 Tax=Treponema sp. TaxID=166 RepID=UPI003FA2264B
MRDFNMDTEHRAAAAEKVLRPAYHDIVVPQEKFAELLEASVRIQDMTNQVNLLVTNAAACLCALDNPVACPALLAVK